VVTAGWECGTGSIQGEQLIDHPLPAACADEFGSLDGPVRAIQFVQETQG
jgi:hypothetical protein